MEATPPTTEAPKTEKESRVKRDFLRKIELEAQEKWENEKVFEYDAPENQEGEKQKYLTTFPFPYMNGRLHLGHSFTFTKAEFASSYQRLKGKNSLFPFGFHCTGMPIKACADKLKKEIETYGNPPVFPVEEEAPVETTPTESVKKEDPTAFHATKAKVQSKSTGAKYQWQIMESNGVPKEEIPKFQDANYWLQYFPPIGKSDLQKFGAGIDWRRSFITTDANPYYDSFVRWQYEILKDLNKVLFGKRYSIYSPKDGQPCADHDRASGEGVLPQEYTLIKQQVWEPLPEKLQSLTGKKVYLVPGTLRPETMYGQTNVWILPEGDYGAFEINDTDVFICTERAARNLAFQGFSKVPGKFNCLLKLKGWDLLGMPVKAPLAKYPLVYVLPMSTISPAKGTGVVTSVPSDSPDDYTSFEELKNKPAYRSKFGITDEMIMPFDVVEIINVPGLGNCAAAQVCKDMKVNGPKDPRLAEAKETVYSKGFYEGKLIVGEFSGRLVKDAKPLIKEKMIASGEAIVYSEPAGVVISRSGDECVVAHSDQWYLNYGEENWRKQVEAHMKNMEFYSPDTRRRFEIALGWLNQWACSRSYGLGTKLPWDEQYLIESLSDSTIYMSYYTIAHLLQGGTFDGSKTGPSGIKPEQLTRKVWNYILLGEAYPEDCGIKEETLKKLRTEFEYWYPVDLRVSGKDLITNHLVFFLYNHLAMFKEDKLPRSIRANGHALLNAQKMSKSTGNFLTLSESVDLYSVDGTRFACADAGDHLDDANISTKGADGAVLRFYTYIKWVEEVLESKDLRTSGDNIFADTVFESEINRIINETEQHYEKTYFREAIQSGWFALQAAKDRYIITVADKGMKKDLILRFIEVQALIMTPVTPHVSEYVWKLLGKTGSVRRALWPVSGKIDEIALKQNDYFNATAHTFRLKREVHMKPKKKGSTEKIPAPTKAIIQVAQAYPEWKQRILTLVKPNYETGTPDDKADLKLISADEESKKHIKKAMPFLAGIRDQFKAQGISALDLKLPYDEKAFLESNAEYLKSTLDVKELEIKYADEDTISKDKCSPGQPNISFE